jgi:hypothetical protein
MIGFACLRHVASLEVDLDALRRRPGNRIVSRTIGSEAIIAVADAGSDWNRFRKL